jgi:NMD protein affecting ribosome stability and mRNA decay
MSSTDRHHHRHKAITRRAIRQRAGVPYEVERKVCASCQRVLDEKRLRRTAA